MGGCFAENSKPWLAAHPELCQSIVLTDMGEELCVALNGALD